MNKRVGFIGLGLMGHGMAKNLVEKGFPLTVLGHRNPTPVEDLVQRGAKEAKDAGELVRASDVVILCVTGTPQVEDLVYRAGGILDSLRSGQIVIDTSTSQPGSTLKIAADMRAKGARFVDAPLTRTPIEAEQGRLNSIVGCDPATFEEIKPVLHAYSENIFHVGEVSAGNKIKLVNNFATIGQMALIAESLVACAKWGVDPKAFFQLISLGGANSGVFQKLAGQAVEGDFTPLKFALANAAKDVRYYNQLALETGLAAPMAAATMQTMQTAINLGFGTPEHLVGSLVPAQAKLNGVEFPPRKPA
jgi:3-hydroxyisobutyrate dehydrogenase-like beta-hydroxyacid dehydrogenase